MDSYLLFNSDNKSKYDVPKINIDELYEKRHKRCLKELETYKRILSNVHSLIKHVSRSSTQSLTYLWYRIPETILGAVNYNVVNCVNYLIEQLEDNHFQVYFSQPNKLFISWGHWCPKHVRDEYKRKTGIEVNEFGEVVPDDTLEDNSNKNQPNQSNQNKNNNENYNKTDNYKPSGSLIYSDTTFNKLKSKMTENEIDAKFKHF